MLLMLDPRDQTGPRPAHEAPARDGVKRQGHVRPHDRLVTQIPHLPQRHVRLALNPKSILAMALTGLLSVRGVHYGPLDSTPDCSLVNGGIIQPAADTSVSNGDTVPFAFAEGFTNQCHDDYTPISAWLLAAQPISGSLNANHEFDDFLFHFGDYMINNFPTIIPQKGTPPPANLSIPDLGVEFRGRDVYIAVVQSAGGCPPDGHINWCFSSNVLHYITN